MPKAFETGALYDERLDFTTNDGDVRECLVSAFADRDERGKVQRMLVVVHDVTERNRAEAEKRKAFDEIARLNEELKRERDYLREEFKIALNFGQIVGSSAAINRILEQVEKVQGLSDEALRDARRANSPNRRTDAALKFAKALESRPAQSPDRQLARLRSVGFSDTEIAEIVAHSVLVSLSNYFYHVSSFALDFPSVDLAEANQ